jgi:hypothetical protein
LYSVPLKYARVDDALNIYLYVSNANTGNDSIRVFGFGEILKCENGVTLTKTASVRIIHVKDVQSILSRVTNAVREVMEKLGKEKEFWVEAVEKLQYVQVTEDEMMGWVNRLLETLPYKYRGYFRMYLNRNMREFGRNAEALFQAVTALVPRVKNYTLHKQLDKCAHEILAIARTR